MVFFILTIFLYNGIIIIGFCTSMIIIPAKAEFIMSAKIENTNNNQNFPYIRNIAVMFLCIIINIAGRQLSSFFDLPGWFDTYGTFGELFYRYRCRLYGKKKVF